MKSVPSRPTSALPPPPVLADPVEDAFIRAAEIVDQFKCFDAIKPDWEEPDTTTDYYRFLLWTQRNMWKQRDRAFPLLVNLGGCMYGPHVTTYAEEIFNVNDAGEWLHPHIIWTENDKLGHNGDTVSFGSGLMTSQAAHYYLDDFMRAQGPLDLSPYPPSTREFLASSVERYLTQMLTSPAPRKRREP